MASNAHQEGATQGFTQGDTQGSSMVMTQGACSQTDKVQQTRKAKPYKPVRAQNKKVVTSMSGLKNAIRSSPRNKSKTKGGRSYATQ